MTTQQGPAPVDQVADYIRDEVCCPRIHGCELNGAPECPAERVRALQGPAPVDVELAREKLAVESPLPLPKQDREAVTPFDLVMKELERFEWEVNQPEYGEAWSRETMRENRAVFILEALTRKEDDYRRALEVIADGKVPPDQHGHYLAHREAVRIARAALSGPQGTEAALSATDAKSSLQLPEGG